MTSIVSPCGNHEYAPIKRGVDVLFILQRKPTDAEVVLCAGICADNGHRTYAVQWVETRRSKKVPALTTSTGRERLHQAANVAGLVVWCCPVSETLVRQSQHLGLDEFGLPKAPYKGAKIQEWE